MRARLGVLLVATLVIVGACSAASTPIPTSTPGATVAPAASAVEPASPAEAGTPAAGVTPSAEATLDGRWVPAGTMKNGAVSHAIRLPDGRVLTLAVGGSAEIWDPAGGGVWHQAPSLPKWRGAFAAVALSDGRVLVTGGRNAGKASSTCPNLPSGEGAQSYSSTYILDPQRLDQGWVRAGLLGTARTAPSVALLPDGRVLVAGGYYLSGEGEEYGAAIEAQVVAYRATPPDPSEASPPPRADTDPGPPIARALATAELFDPATGEWTSTGPMKYARYLAQAVTLSDGRVLIASSIEGQWHGVAGVDYHAYATAEIYDAATGRFALTGDPSRIGEVGPDSLGTLVALPGGDAVLVGMIVPCKHCPDSESSFAFDARSNEWSLVEAVEWGWHWETGFVRPPANISRSGAAVAALPGDRVLVAGGLWFDKDGDSAETSSAELFDPRTHRWQIVSPMPEPRAGALAVALTDGSVLVVGGRNTTTARLDWETCAGPSGLTNAIRYLPGS